MKIFGITLLFAAGLATLLAIAANSPGIHSTPGIWLTILNLPGALFCVWMEGTWGFIVCALVNGLIYWALFTGGRKIFA